MITIVILAGPRAEVVDALRSCDRLRGVDRVLVVGTENAPPVDVVGCKPLPSVYDLPGGFGELRTRAATLASTDLVLFLDADERLVVHDPDALRDVDGPRTIHNAIGMFLQTKIVRRDAAWVGHVHEFCPSAHDAEPVSSLALEVAEIPKDARAVSRKVARDRTLLQRAIAGGEHLDRWHFYAGETERLAGDHAHAIHHYQRAAERQKPGPWGAECAGWAMFKAARSAHEGGVEDPLPLIVSGLARCPWMVELPWFAAWLALQEGAKDRGEAWARMARALRGTGPRRRGFREDAAHEEGPDEILRALGVAE